jgi:hypothetical protein
MIEDEMDDLEFGYGAEWKVGHETRGVGLFRGGVKIAKGVLPFVEDGDFFVVFYFRDDDVRGVQLVGGGTGTKL